MENVLNRHARIVLQFSGGKDSLACLLLLRPWWDRLVVLWLNTGACLPETIEQMKRVQAMVPNFVEITTNQPEQIERAGYPVDVLPLRNHATVGKLCGFDRPKLQSFLDCCYTNLMAPMHEAAKNSGATLIVRGQKRGDIHRGPYESGAVVAGIEYLFPVEDWTDEQVLDYVADSGLLPEHYDQGNTSMDCWNCTAYLSENAWKLRYLYERYPDKADVLRLRLEMIEREIDEDMRHLRAALEQ